MSYLQLMTEYIRKANRALFGANPTIFQVNMKSTSDRFLACSYVMSSTAAAADPDIVWVLKEAPAVNTGFFVIFHQRLDKQIDEAIQGRPHIKPPVVVWSICTKVILEKVWTEKLLADPDLQISDIMLTPEQILDCLPHDYEFTIEFDGFTNLQTIELLYGQEDREYHRLVQHLEQPNSGLQATLMVDQLVQRSVISHIAVRCRSEEDLIQFLNNCKVAVMSL